MYQKGNFYRSRSFYTNKGLSIQKKPKDPPTIIDRYYVPIYRNYFLETKQLMPYTPNISFIDFKKRNDPTKTIGEFILDDVLAYGKNLTDITKIEIDPEVDMKQSYISQVYTKVSIFDDTWAINQPDQYGIWSYVTTSGDAQFIVTNTSKYIFTITEDGYQIQMLPGVNEITITGTITTSKNNIDSSGNVSDTQYDSSTTSPIQNEYKGYTSNVEGNLFALKFISCVQLGYNYNYSMLQLKVYF